MELCSLQHGSWVCSKIAETSNCDQVVKNTAVFSVFKLLRLLVTHASEPPVTILVVLGWTMGLFREFCLADMSFRAVECFRCLLHVLLRKAMKLLSPFRVANVCCADISGCRWGGEC